MEKWIVVSAIWTMCAFCAVLFIRGATCSATRDPARLRVDDARESADSRAAQN